MDVNESQCIPFNLGKSLAGWKMNSFRFKQNSKATCKFRRCQRQVFWICADFKGKTFRLEQLPKAIPLNQTDFKDKSSGFEQVLKGKTVTRISKKPVIKHYPTGTAGKAGKAGRAGQAMLYWKVLTVQHCGSAVFQKCRQYSTLAMRDCMDCLP